MLKLDFTTNFKKDLILAKKRNLDISSLNEVVGTLLQEIPLGEKYRDHKLSGDYIGHRECHIKPDWLLIYYVGNNTLVLTRTGTHSDLF